MTAGTSGLAALQPPVVVAVPAKDEAERIGDCLRALAWQQGSRGHRVLLLLNNCRDATERVARDIAADLPIAVTIQSIELTPDSAGAGHARRIAMQAAADIAGPCGIIMTTDADGRVAPDWIATNLAAIRNGAEAVAGRAVIDPDEAACIPAHLHQDDAVECAYAALLDRIDHLVDPDRDDPWPRHSEHSGASLAVTVAAFRRSGGIPPVAIGEDRGFVASLRRVDASIRHAPEVWVSVSGRTDGRAIGGMAETIRRRIIRQDEWIDDRLEPARLRLRRARLRRQFRSLRLAPPSAAAIAHLAQRLALAPATVAAAAALPYCGAGWDYIEAASGVLRPEPVRRADLSREVAAARFALRRLARSGDRAPARRRAEAAIAAAA